MKMTIKLLHGGHIGPIDNNDHVLTQIEIVFHISVILIVVDDESSIQSVRSLYATVSMIDVSSELAGHKSVLEHRVWINWTLSDHLKQNQKIKRLKLGSESNHADLYLLDTPSM